MRKILTYASLILCCTPAFAGNPADGDTLEIRTLSRVSSTILGEDNRIGIDTLKTSDPRVKLVLYSDKTWGLCKNYDLLCSDEIMNEFWNSEKVQPYTVSRDSLPFRVVIQLTDSTERYCCPCKGPVFSKFGIRHGRNHNGVDLPSPIGTPVYATFCGKVRVSMYTKGYGNLVILRHPNGLETYYGHLSARGVEPGDWVEAGQVIGKVGSTGHSTGPHLHLETRYRGHAFDPQWIIDFNDGDLKMDVFILKKKFLSTYSSYTPDSFEDEEIVMKSEEEERAEAERIEAERRAMRYHTVRSGDTLSRIASVNGKSIKAICALNPGLTTKTVLKIGRKIRVN